MITLFTFGRKFGLPDPSPFVVKAEVLLKMAGLPFKLDTNGFRKAPKGKLPYIEENGKLVGDSTFIRFHLEEKHGVDLDKGLSKSEKAIAWTYEKMCDEHLYWAMIDMRWMVDENFYKGPATFFEGVPFLLRPFIVSMIRGKFRKSVKAQGFGRHSRPEIERLGIRDVDAIAEYLGDKKYFMGDRSTSIDATIFAFVSGILCPHFNGPIRTAAEKHANLRTYSDRMMREFFPDLVTTAKTARSNGKTAHAANL